MLGEDWANWGEAAASVLVGCPSMVLLMVHKLHGWFIEGFAVHNSVPTAITVPLDDDTFYLALLMTQSSKTTESN